jgi:hypothetical protein
MGTEGQRIWDRIKLSFNRYYNLRDIDFYASTAECFHSLLHADLVIIDTMWDRCADENTILFLKVSNCDARAFVRTGGL